MRTRGVFILMLVVALSLVGCSHYYVEKDMAPPALPMPYLEGRLQLDKARCATPLDWYSRTFTDVRGHTKEEFVCGTLAGINLFDFGNWLFYRPIGDVHEIKPLPYFAKRKLQQSQSRPLCEANWYTQKYIDIGGNAEEFLVCTTPRTDEMRPVGALGYFGFGGAPFFPMFGGFGGTQYWPR